MLGTTTKQARTTDVRPEITVRFTVTTERQTEKLRRYLPTGFSAMFLRLQTHKVQTNTKEQKR